MAERDRPPGWPEPLEGEEGPGELEPPAASEPPAEAEQEQEIEDPLEREDVRWSVGEAQTAPLAVTVDEGPVESSYAPAELIARVAERVAILLKEFGGGIAPMLYGVQPAGSMVLFFGDPDPRAEQERLPINLTATHAARVAELIDLEGDELFARALEIGAPMRQYSELTQLVQAEGVTLMWAVRRERTRVLTQERAQRQHTRLNAPVETRDRPLNLNGTLYRVITESQREGFLGSVGIHLHSWSTPPPERRNRTRVIAYYEDAAVEQKIKAGLVGESVEARLLVRQPIPGTSIEPERFDLVLKDLELGPGEDSIFGDPFDVDEART